MARGLVMRVLFIGAHVGKGGGLALQTFQVFTGLSRHIDVDLLCLAALGVHRSMAELPGVRFAGPLVFPTGAAFVERAVRAVRVEYDLLQAVAPYFALPPPILTRVSPPVLFSATE